MLYRLVSMGVITHVHNLHFAYFVYHLAIIAVVEHGRKGENRVEHGRKSLVAAHQRDKSAGVMKHRPRVMPAISLGKNIAPLQWVVGFLPLAVLLSATHQVKFLAEKVAIVLGAAFKLGPFFLGFAQCLTQLGDAPVVVSIL